MSKLTNSSSISETNSSSISETNSCSISESYNSSISETNSSSINESTNDSSVTTSSNLSYLENPICKFTPLFDIDYSVKKNLLCCSFFKMASKSYKDLSIYVNGLKVLHDYRVRETPGYYLRLFIDESIYSDKEIMAKLNKLDKLEMVLYSCPNFTTRMENSNVVFHEGVFGMMVRFFPMYDFPNNDANIVLITDIDISSKERIYTFDLIDTIKKNIEPSVYNNIEFYKFGNISKNIKYGFDYIYQQTNQPTNNKLLPMMYSISQSTVSFKRIPSEVIVNFINKVKQSEPTKEYSYYYRVKKDFMAPTKFDYDSNFIYGTDEYYFNYTLSNYMYEHNRPMALNISFTITSPFYHYLNYIKYIPSEKAILINRLLNYVIKKIDANLFEQMTQPKNIRDIIELEQHDILKAKFKIIDDIIYGKNSNIKPVKANKAVYKLAIYLFTKPEYHFILQKQLLQLIFQEKYFGLYDFNTIVFCGEPIGSTSDFFINKKSFKKKTIIKLKTYYDKIKLKLN